MQSVKSKSDYSTQSPSYAANIAFREYLQNNPHPASRTYKIEFEDGSSEIIHNLSNFCRVYGYSLCCVRVAMQNRRRYICRERNVSFWVHPIDGITKLKPACDHCGKRLRKNAPHTPICTPCWIAEFQKNRQIIDAVSNLTKKEANLNTQPSKPEKDSAGELYKCLRWLAINKIPSKRHFYLGEGALIADHGFEVYDRRFVIEIERHGFFLRTDRPDKDGRILIESFLHFKKEFERLLAKRLPKR